MSYSSTNPNQSLSGTGSFVSNEIGNAIGVNPAGPIDGPAIANLPEVSFGDTSGPNAVNPSGTPNGVTLPTQNNFS